MSIYKTFKFEGKDLPVKFIEQMQVVKGVDCQVYEFENDNTKDLGIVTIESGCKTPTQQVKKGIKTIEGYISGIGILTIIKPTGEKKVYNFPNDKHLLVEIELEDIMQWQASDESILQIFEICYPPYQDGRFQNLDL